MLHCYLLQVFLLLFPKSYLSRNLTEMIQECQASTMGYHAHQYLWKLADFVRTVVDSVSCLRHLETLSQPVHKNLGDL